MIFVDPSEVRDDTRLDLGTLEFITTPGLEECTGADIMVSPLAAPATTRPLLHMHIRKGAVLVQRKHRLDLVSSLEGRLKASLFRMRSCGARQGQCLLLFIGVLTCDHDGMAMIDGQPTFRSFWSVYAGLSTWNKYGGCVEPSLSRASLFPDWARMKERHILEAYENPVREFVEPVEAVYEVDPADPVQELVQIKDWRRTAMCCPGWGITRINQLRALMLEDGAADTLMAAVNYMTHPELVKKRIKGIGPSLFKKARKWYFGSS